MGVILGLTRDSSPGREPSTSTEQSGVTEGGKEHFFTTGNGQGFCMPECLRTSFMPTSCRSREDSHG